HGDVAAGEIGHVNLVGHRVHGNGNRARARRHSCRYSLCPRVASKEEQEGQDTTYEQFPLCVYQIHVLLLSDTSHALASQASLHFAKRTDWLRLQEFLAGPRRDGKGRGGKVQQALAGCPLMSA